MWKTILGRSQGFGSPRGTKMSKHAAMLLQHPVAATVWCQSHKQKSLCCPQDEVSEQRCGCGAETGFLHLSNLALIASNTFGSSICGYDHKNIWCHHQLGFINFHLYLRNQPNQRSCTSHCSRPCHKALPQCLERTVAHSDPHCR